MTRNAERQRSGPSWLRAGAASVSGRGFREVTNKLDKLREVWVGSLEMTPEIAARQ